MENRARVMSRGFATCNAGKRLRLQSLLHSHRVAEGCDADQRFRDPPDHSGKRLRRRAFRVIPFRSGSHMLGFFDLYLSDDVGEQRVARTQVDYLFVQMTMNRFLDRSGTGHNSVSPAEQTDQTEKTSPENPEKSARTFIDVAFTHTFPEAPIMPSFMLQSLGKKESNGRRQPMPSEQLSFVDSDRTRFAGRVDSENTRSGTRQRENTIDIGRHHAVKLPGFPPKNKSMEKKGTSIYPAAPSTEF